MDKMMRRLGGLVTLALLNSLVCLASPKCTDYNNQCVYWATQGECEANPTYMVVNCAESCKACDLVSSVDITGEVYKEEDDESFDEATFFSESEAAGVKNPGAYLKKNEKGQVSVKVANLLAEPMEVLWMPKEGSAPATALFTLKPGLEADLSTVVDHGFSVRVLGEEVSRFRIFPDRPKVIIDARAVELFKSSACDDAADGCEDRAKRGECVTAPGWMSMMCSRSCFACYLRDPAVRCPRKNLNVAQAPSLKAGDMNALFSKLHATWPKFNVTIHSGPADLAEEAAKTAPEKFVADGPWIATFDNFVTEKEVAALIKSVEKSFSRSTDQGKVDEFGMQEKVVSTGRTSENAWCTGACETDPATVAVMERIEAVTHIPTENYESFQVLRYLPGQHYRTHHDMSGSDNKLACGPRVYTFFLYLSDVEEGGETEFPFVKGPDGEPIRVKPKLGSALLWPSVFSDDPTKQDSRTKHAALPVIKGTKFAANAWIHQFDYSEPNLWGCTGSFD